MPFPMVPAPSTATVLIESIDTGRSSTLSSPSAYFAASVSMLSTMENVKLTWFGRVPLVRLVLRERKPSNERCEFLVLGPGRTERLAEIGDFRHQDRLGDRKVFHRSGNELFFLLKENRELALRATLAKGFTEQLAIGGMNQSVGRQDFFKWRERLAGGQDKRAAGEPMPALDQNFFDVAQ